MSRYYWKPIAPEKMAAVMARFGRRVLDVTIISDRMAAGATADQITTEITARSVGLTEGGSD